MHVLTGNVIEIKDNQNGNYLTITFILNRENKSRYYMLNVEEEIIYNKIQKKQKKLD
jgi:hypothetical protein